MLRGVRKVVLLGVLCYRKEKGERRQGVTLIVTTEALVILNSNYFLHYNYKVSNYYKYYNRLCLTYCQ